MKLIKFRVNLLIKFKIAIAALALMAEVPALKLYLEAMLNKQQKVLYVTPTQIHF